VAQIRLLLVDDNVTFLQIASLFLGQYADLCIVGTGHNGREALDLAATLHPDVVLLDISMEGVNGLEALPHLRQAFPSMGIIVLTQHNLEGYREAALAAGADGFVVKRSLVSDLLPAIRRAVRVTEETASGLTAETHETKGSPAEGDLSPLGAKTEMIGESSKAND
jgi:DNA-binding NarL/FixJ family response regulator